MALFLIYVSSFSRWEHNPWTACSVSCGGGIQRRSFVCVEETIHGEILQVEEWKCMYAPKPKVIQTCNLFDCPKWVAMEWSQVSQKVIWTFILIF